MKYCLFDIDGTLILSGGAGKHAMHSTLQHCFELNDLKDEVKFSGRTDRAIISELLELHGIESNDANRQRFLNQYLQQLPLSLNECGGTILPGIQILLRELTGRDDIVLGLLTGNIRAGAHSKLSHFELWHYFSCGGYGDNHLDRDDVAREAFDSLSSQTSQAVNASEVWVLGDTPLDIQCARAIGARVVAVATGWNSAQELEASEPDWLLNDLSETDKILSLLLSR